MKLSTIIPEKHKFIVTTYFLAGFFLSCFSVGFYLYLHHWNLDIFVKFVTASFLLAFPITFLVAYRRAGKK